MIWDDETKEAIKEIALHVALVLQSTQQSTQQATQQATEQAQATTQGTTKAASETVMEDVSAAERMKATGVVNDGLLFLNQKTVADAYQQLGVASGYQYLTHNAALQNAAVIALTQAIESGDLRVKDILESANMTGKQAIRHGDLAIKHQWEDCEKDD